jgi:hypothetical protein
MKRLFTFFAFILLSSALFAQSQAIISFKAMGHNDDEPIFGMSGATSFYYKIPPQYEINGSKLVIYFEPSQALVKDKSYINLLIGSKPVYSGRLTKDSIQRIAINLTRADITADNFLKVQVKTSLSITDDKCRDLDNPAMWVKIKTYSFVSLIKSNKNFFNHINISNCFDSKSAIVYPSNPSLHDLKAVAWAYSRLKKTSIKNIGVYEVKTCPIVLETI